MMIMKMGPLAVMVLLLSGCVYPYETAFQTCDNDAGACYRYCEDTAGEEEITACRSSCETEANICCDQAYGAQEYNGSAYASPGPWYGSFGYWRPTYGYAFSLDYYSYGGRRGNFRDPYYGSSRGRGRQGFRDGRDRRDGRRDDRRGNRDGGPRGDAAGDGRGQDGARGRGPDGRRATPPSGTPRQSRPPRARPPQNADPAPQAAPPVRRRAPRNRRPRNESQREPVIEQ